MAALVEFLRTAWVVRLARIAVGVLFLAAALGKIGDIGRFADQIVNYRLLPLAMVNVVAIALPWIELLAGIALVLGVRARSGAVIVLVLMAVFTVAVGSAWARGLDFECGCFGKASAATIGMRKFAENAGFTLLAWVATLAPRRN